MRKKIVELINEDLPAFVSNFENYLEKKDRARIIIITKKFTSIIKLRDSELKKMTKENKESVRDLKSELAWICMVCKKYPTTYYTKLKNEAKTLDKIYKAFSKKNKEEEKIK